MVVKNRSILLCLIIMSGKLVAADDDQQPKNGAPQRAPHHRAKSADFHSKVPADVLKEQQELGKKIQCLVGQNADLRDELAEARQVEKALRGQVDLSRNADLLVAYGRSKDLEKGLHGYRQIGRACKELQDNKQGRLDPHTHLQSVLTKGEDFGYEGPEIRTFINILSDLMKPSAE